MLAILPKGLFLDNIANHMKVELAEECDYVWEYKAEFVNTYFKIIDSAAHKDRENVLKYSREVGFLTGYESQAMNDAHIDSVMLLAVSEVSLWWWNCPESQDSCC